MGCTFVPLTAKVMARSNWLEDDEVGSCFANGARLTDNLAPRQSRRGKPVGLAVEHNSVVPRHV